MRRFDLYGFKDFRAVDKISPEFGYRIAVDGKIDEGSNEAVISKATITWFGIETTKHNTVFENVRKSLE